MTDEDAAKDLDETRRLLYMTLAAPHTKRHNLVGTLVNALAHHGQGIDPAEAMDYLLRAIEPGPAGSVDADAVEWVRSKIAGITGQLDG